ncbi:MAG: FAD-dependent oxidoreductase [Dehalococcoidia bacterium]|nr:FAD-dependent oxidoreductase [Dehalococcoidia bacterium]
MNPTGFLRKKSSTMSQFQDVVIVGGGAAGCAVAYYLAKSGIKSTVIERDGIAANASGYSAGGLNPLEGAGIPGPLGPLAIRSYRMHAEIAPELTELSGVDFGYKVISSIRVAFDQSELSEMQTTHDTFQSADADFSAEWLDASQLRGMEPRLSPSAIRALDTHGNAVLSSHRYTLALAKSAETMGAKVVSGTVTGVRVSGGRVTAVLTDSGEISCDAVVFATGPWAGQVEEWLGIHVPIEPFKGEILRMKLDGPPLGRDYHSADVDLNHREDTQIWVGATEERVGFDRNPSAKARAESLRTATNLMPAMKDAELVLHTACLRPLSPDWMPIVGSAPGWDNAYLATGAGKKGILISPGMGKAVANLITTGETDMPVEGFGPERFAEDKSNIPSPSTG